MAKGLGSRGGFRDRHARGMRRPLLDGRKGGWRSGEASFEQIVASTCDYLRANWPDQLENLRWQVSEAPTLSPDSTEIRRWTIRPDKHMVILFRLPIERLGRHRRLNPLDERMHIEHNVFAAVGALIDKDPWDLIRHRH